ncbi:MAG: NADH-quinone oxidoreductase subunit C [Bacillota bacterium]
MTFEDFLNKFSSQVTSSHRNGNRLFFYVRDKDLPAIARFLFQELGCRLSTSTGAEVYDGLEVTHHFSDDRRGRYFCPTVKMARGKPEMPSITGITRAASWIEREIHDLFGIVFLGHPNPAPLLKEDNKGMAETPLRHARKKQ